MNFFIYGLAPFSGFWGALTQIVGWTVVLLLPLAILLLYFLKLRRQPLQVPSTYLWSRTIEDLHVNSIWQRLRRSLLLFLQLLFAALLLLSLLRPGCRGTQLEGDRFIFLIDTSASMAAEVDGKSRLEIAREEAKKLIESMKSGDSAMLISFSDRATIEQSFIDNKSVLLRKLAAIRQTQRRTDLDEALRAASGLANPGRSSQDARDFQVADALPATMYILTDGGVKKVPEFSMGNLQPEYLPIGSGDLKNVGIIDFSVESNPENLQQRQAFARILNGGSEDMTIDLSLYLNDRLRDSLLNVTVKSGDELRQPFDLSVSDGLDVSGILRLEIETKDDLAEDNVAYVVFNPPRRSKVLLVTQQNTALETSLRTSEVRRSAEVDMQLPSYLNTDEYKKNAETGFYDLVIFDSCSPESMPQANTFFIASTPPDENWSLGPKQTPVLIVDSANTHPMLSMVDLRNILIADAAEVNGPKGSTSLIDSRFGSIFLIGPRGGYEDAVMGFAIIETDDSGDLLNNTDWPRYLSFPLFIQNVVQHLGSRSTLNTLANVAPGASVELRGSVPVDEIRVQGPDGNRQRIKASGENTFLFSGTDLTGIYEISEGSSKSVDQRFAVNILDKRESDLTVAENLEIGYETVEAASHASESRFEFWKWLLIFGFVLLCVEWYIYNRRVFL